MMKGAANLASFGREFVAEEATKRSEPAARWRRWLAFAGGYAARSPRPVDQDWSITAG
jgi:hypothetical protein